jgi:hypothetical protein
LIMIWRYVSSWWWCSIYSPPRWVRIRIRYYWNHRCCCFKLFDIAYIIWDKIDHTKAIGRTFSCSHVLIVKVWTNEVAVIGEMNLVIYQGYNILATVNYIVI